MSPASTLTGSLTVDARLFGCFGLQSPSSAVFSPIRLRARIQFQYKRFWSEDEAIKLVSFSSSDEKSAVDEKLDAIAQRGLHLD
jgi:hypothetical protein